MNTALPTTISAYIVQLRRALQGADPAMIQDALHDAEEYLRAELAAHPDKSEAEVIAAVAGSYGDPDEVADIYRDTEETVQAALNSSRSRAPAMVPRIGGESEMRMPDPPPPAPSIWRAVFGVFNDPRTYGALFYMLLSLATGIFYFTWTVTGLSLSLGMMILIVGLPLFVLFIGASRILALVEGRIVEVMLGERMPRRSVYSDGDLPLLKRIAAMFTDLRTWSTFLYFLLLLPLGIGYFTVAVTGLSTALALMFALFASLFTTYPVIHVDDMDVIGLSPWAAPLMLLAGFTLLTVTLHIARLIGQLHGKLAKHLLVKV